ncbi:HpcH/HpaI aldolase/citrate lyase family protein [Sinorhizobium meliloti]|uniref:HpcH/HpaI aldolase/citrate lyase family protein n=1 Tax=Rhizobium meliloti TaxID=382 RepID=UPI000D1F5A17|nr:CoA ester lyase [Sinorhizobium meliloti]MDW9418005.1 CoA ester lyase [Sinorhizobium meliloti]MDW9483577.1 CoA ester lyase [Sinorhizobium meliloti]MDW9514752.1 CoA ester lyase [Sinorhizobium meliloti]MDW9639205.1 CoA ester lyase [Sinorhizobium meliloti]MDW9670691.1 CoA ester lyase [Sinorhizobium meliloti]
MRAIDHHPVRLRRSVLSVPADNQRALAKVRELAADAVIFDLEDSVSPDRKAAARDALVRHLAGNRPQGETVIRVNAAGSGFGEADLAAALAARPDAILLPKVESPADIQGALDWLSERDTPDELRLWAMIETPRGVVNGPAIAETGRTSGGRLDCFVVGLNDLRKETGVPALPGRTYLVPWLMQILLAARGSGLDAIDAVFNDFRDPEGFEAECRQGRDMGFDGKMLIHPAQIDAANRHFAADEAAVEEARAIIEAFALPDNAGKGVINLHGRMVERLHLEQAMKIAAKADIIEKRKAKS